MADLDWFPFEPGRWLKNTLHLTARQNGAYLSLTLAAFEARGKLPGSDAGLMTIAKLSPRDWKEDGDVLKAFLTREGDIWVHEFARHQRADAEQRVAAKSKAGKAGADKRWNGRGNGTAIAEPSVRQCQTDAQLQEQEQVSNTDQVERGALPRSRTQGAQHGTRLPADWRPSPDERGFAVDQGLDPDVTADTFRDYWHGVPGAKGRKVDWPGTWRNWCRRDRAGPVGKGTARAIQPARGNDAFYLELAAISDRSLAGAEPVREGRAVDPEQVALPDEARHAPR